MIPCKGWSNQSHWSGKAMHGAATAGMIKIVLQGSKFVQADYNYMAEELRCYFQNFSC